MRCIFKCHGQHWPSHLDRAHAADLQGLSGVTRIHLDEALVGAVHHHESIVTRLYAQVLHCVIANAFKYTRKGSVNMTTYPSGEGQQYLTFRCDDTGPGFSNDQVRSSSRAQTQLLCLCASNDGIVRLIPSV